MDSKVSFIKTDDNIIINETCIRWVKKMNDCLEVCAKSSGCVSDTTTMFRNTHRICKENSPVSFKKLNAHFEEKIE